MLALLLSTLIALPSPQEPSASDVEAVAVRGDAELSPSDALASAQDRASARAEADSEAFAWSDLKQSVRPRWKRGVASATGY